MARPVTWYQALVDLSSGPRRGELFDGASLPAGAADILLRRRRIGAVPWPPLALLPGWERRAAELDRLGIVSVGDLLAAGDKELAAVPDADPAGWREEAVAAARILFNRKCKSCD